MAVRKGREKFEVDRKRGPFGLGCARQNCFEHRLAPLENIFETADILAGNAIAARRLGHGGFERDSRGLGDIVPLRASEPGRRRAYDRAERELGVLHIE